MTLLGRLRSFVRQRPWLRAGIERSLGRHFHLAVQLVQRGEHSTYGIWRRARRREGLALPPPPAEAPLIMVELGRGPIAARLRSVRALRAQSDPGWRLVSGAEGRDEARAAGAFLMFLAPGEVLAPHAVARLRSEAKPGCDVLYADEESRDRFVAVPWMKPSFDPELLLTQDAWGRCVAYRATALPASHLEGHALALAMAAPWLRGGPAPIRHIPDVLLTRRTEDKAPWRDGFDAAAVACTLEADARGARLRPEPDGLPRVTWPVPEPAPLVSVIIPTRDHADLLEPCLDGLLRRTDYPALEIVVLDNGSVEPRALAVLEEAALDPRVRVVRWTAPFNYSAINNHAVAASRGDVLLLLNNDTEVLHPDWLREMVSLADRPEIGAVGCRLLYPDGRIQHQGVVLGLGGVAGHDFAFTSANADGPQDLLRHTRSVSAVTAACLAVRRSVFEAVGGFDEESLVVAYNDVDFCIRVREAGFRNVVTPFACLSHKESASRGH
jgi:GT2 family glycosyltransferase